MKALVTIPSIECESAGTSYSVPSLCGALSKNGVDVQLHVLDKVPNQKRGYIVKNYVRYRFPVSALGRSPEMLKAFKQELKGCDVVHNNGIWMMPNVYPSIAKRGTNCKLVFCPRGGLSNTALNRSKIKKFLMGHLCGQYKALRETDMFHAASMKELEEIRALGYKQPIALVPNGIDIPNLEHKPFEEATRKIAFFGRIHATKAVDYLVEAWGNVSAKFPNWSLEIAGPDCGAVPLLKKIKAGQRINVYVEAHQKKSGTPTMGGIIILICVLIFYRLLLIEFKYFYHVELFECLFLIIPIILYGLIGFVDDYLIIFNLSH